VPVGQDVLFINRLKSQSTYGNCLPRVTNIVLKTHLLYKPCGPKTPIKVLKKKKTQTVRSKKSRYQHRTESEPTKTGFEWSSVVINGIRIPIVIVNIPISIDIVFMFSSHVVRRSPAICTFQCLREYTSLEYSIVMYQVLLLLYMVYTSIGCTRAHVITVTLIPRWLSLEII
jgi:hypothetical protein